MPPSRTVLSKCQSRVAQQGEDGGQQQKFALAAGTEQAELLEVVEEPLMQFVERAAVGQVIVKLLK